MTPDAKIRFNCAQCSKNVSAPLAAAGRRGSCPHCGYVNAIPAAPLQPAKEKSVAEKEPAKTASDDKAECQRCHSRRKLRLMETGASLCQRCAKEIGARPQKPPRQKKPPRVKPPRRRTIRTKIRGVSECNDDGTSRQSLIRGCRAGEVLIARREPWNRYDKNAIAVVTASGEQLGYLSSDLAEQLAPLADAQVEFAIRIAEITGGGTWFTPQHRGVNIEIQYTEPPTAG